PRAVVTAPVSDRATSVRVLEASFSRERDGAASEGVRTYPVMASETPHEGAVERRANPLVPVCSTVAGSVSGCMLRAGMLGAGADTTSVGVVAAGVDHTGSVLMSGIGFVAGGL